jgi:hypothetical protein
MLPTAPMRPLRRDEHQPLRARRCVVLASVVKNVTRLTKCGRGEECESKEVFHAGWGTSKSRVCLVMLRQKGDGEVFIPREGETDVHARVLFFD